MPTLTWTGKDQAVTAARGVPEADNLLTHGDNLELSTWLSMMYPRLKFLRELLAEAGSI